jgi:starch phosphorylase
MATLYERYLGPRFRTEPWDAELWKRVDIIPDAELWRSHERRRERLVAFARTRMVDQLKRRGAPESEISLAQQALDPEVLTIGFARRFATYKRATLLFRDLTRLSAILNNKERPIQILVAGKAHPHDTAGKELIKHIVRVSRMPEFAHRIVFIENYDINVCRYLVQGVDVWLNNPRRPLEASGTSGMKVSANGGLNCSVLDGWWDEGYARGNGWAIGSGEEYKDQEYQDALEAQALYELLEKEVAPLYYDRGADGVPKGWIRMMKESIKTHTAFFNTDRMVQEYYQRFYAPGSDLGIKLADNNFAGAAAVAEWRDRLKKNWGSVKVQRVLADTQTEQLVGKSITVKADVALGKISPNEVSVDLYYGPLTPEGQLQHGVPVPMKAEIDTPGLTVYRFVGEVPCKETGRNGFAVRVLPHHKLTAHPYEPGLITWG